MAAEKNVPLVPQGGNTSMVGGATPPADGSALILSLRRMNRIRSISPENNLAICEAGVILANLHEAAQAVDRRFPLSLGAKRSEEHTSELQSLMRISYAVFCLQKTKNLTRIPKAYYILIYHNHTQS